MRRRELGVSQEKLAESIGLTFQQVQKYERAANRVSASKLFELSRALNTSVAYFYEGLNSVSGGADDGEPRTEAVQDFLLTTEGLELAAAFPRIKTGRVRRKLLELVRTLGDEPQSY